MHVQRSTFAEVTSEHGHPLGARLKPARVNVREVRRSGESSDPYDLVPTRTGIIVSYSKYSHLLSLQDAERDNTVFQQFQTQKKTYVSKGRPNDVSDNSEIHAAVTMCVK